jgi:hypothetical protein
VGPLSPPCSKPYVLTSLSDHPLGTYFQDDDVDEKYEDEVYLVEAAKLPEWGVEGVDYRIEPAVGLDGGFVAVKSLTFEDGVMRMQYGLDT